MTKFHRYGRKIKPFSFQPKSIAIDNINYQPLVFMICVSNFRCRRMCWDNYFLESYGRFIYKQIIIEKSHGFVGWIVLNNGRSWAETKKIYAACCHLIYIYDVFFNGNRRSGAAIEHTQQVDTDAEQKSQLDVEYQTRDERCGERY